MTRASPPQPARARRPPRRSSWRRAPARLRQPGRQQRAPGSRQRIAGLEEVDRPGRRAAQAIRDQPPVGGDSHQPENRCERGPAGALPRPPRDREDGHREHDDELAPGNHQPCIVSATKVATSQPAANTASGSLQPRRARGRAPRARRHEQPGRLPGGEAKVRSTSRPSRRRERPT